MFNASIISTRLSNYSVRAPYLPPPHTAEAKKIHGIQRLHSNTFWLLFSQLFKGYFVNIRCQIALLCQLLIENKDDFVSKGKSPDPKRNSGMCFAVYDPQQGQARKRRSILVSSVTWKLPMHGQVNFNSDASFLSGQDEARVVFVVQEQ